MPQSPVPNTAQAVLNFQTTRGDLRNVLHFQQAPDAPFNDIELAPLAEAVYVWWNTNLKAQQSSDLTLQSIICRDMASVGSDAYERAVGVVGGFGQGMLPSNVTIAMSLRTALGGRSGRGRIYHCGLANQQIMGDRITSTTQTALLAAYNNLKVLPPAGIGHEYQLVVVSRFANHAQRATGIKNRVTAISTDGILDSQRRRLEGRGA